MSKEPEADEPTPRPGIVRVLGSFHMVIGLAYSLFWAVLLFFVGPFLHENDPLRIDPALAQEVVHDLRRQSLQELARREEAAKGETEKRVLAKARKEMQDVQVNLAGQVDFQKLNSDLPWLGRYLWATMLSGLAVSVMTLIAGFGLVLLTGWGRRLASLVAVAKVLRVGSLCVLLVAFVVPRLTDACERLVGTDFGKVFVRTAMDAQDPSTRPLPLPTISFKPEEFVGILSSMGYIYAGMGLAIGLIFPLITLIVSSRPAFVAACRRHPVDPLATPSSQ